MTNLNYKKVGNYIVSWYYAGIVTYIVHDEYGNEVYYGWNSQDILDKFGIEI